jgi:hypothetical protein
LVGATRQRVRSIFSRLQGQSFLMDAEDAVSMAARSGADPASRSGGTPAVPTWDEPSAACGAISKTSAWPSLVARLGVHSMWNTQNLVMLCSSLAAIDLVPHPAAGRLLTEVVDGSSRVCTRKRYVLLRSQLRRIKLPATSELAIEVCADKTETAPGGAVCDQRGRTTSTEQAGRCRSSQDGSSGQP